MSTYSPRHRRSSPGRQASALLIVLMISIFLLVGTLTLWFATQSQEDQVVVNLARVQSEFLAKGAHQLALLKARLQAQALYDASDYSVGKNPLYPHSHEAGRTDPYGHLDDDRSGWPTLTTTMVFANGPAFFTPRPPDDGSNPTIARDANLDGSADPVEATVMDLYLARFRADLADGTITTRTDPPPPPPPVPSTSWSSGGPSVTFEVPWIGQGPIQVSQTAPDPVLGQVDPYDGWFHVTDMRILGGRSNRIFDEEALLVSVNTIVRSQAVGQTQEWPTELRRVYKVRREQGP